MNDDGIIKFQYDWKEEALKNSKTIEELIYYRDLAHEKKYIGVHEDGIGYGNISKRAEGGFLVSGSATGSITPSNSSHYSLVHKWSIENNKIWCKGPIAASSESLTHAVIYQELPQINAILHIHHLQLWKRYYHALPSTCSHIPYGTTDMASAVKFLIRNQQEDEGLFLMKGHEEGLVAYAKDMKSVFQIFVDLF